MASSCETFGWISLLVTLVVGALSFILGLTARRPRLIAGGSGSGAIGNNLSATTLSVRNEPAFLGSKIARETAHVRHTRLYDPKEKEYIGPVLKWRVNGTSDLSDRVVIPAGQNAQLYVFAKGINSREYYIFEGSSLAAPDPGRFFFKDGKREFVLVITDEIGRDYRFRFTARHYPHGVAANHKVTLHHRAMLLRSAADSLLRALSLRK